MRTVTRILGWLYAQGLKLYPSGFRDEFGDEMTAVFIEALSDAKQRGWLSLLIWCGREFASLFAGLIREQWLSLRREEAVMKAIEPINPPHNADIAETETPLAIVAGIIPFILFGLMFVLQGVNYHRPLSWMTRHDDLIVLVILLIGLGIGWARRFPRWSYAYLGVAVIYSILLADTATPGFRLFGHTFGRELWGWRGWLPLLALTAVMLLITRSLRPLAHLIQGVRRDWTLLSFALYTALAWLFLLVAYDGKTWYDQTPYLPLNLFLQALALTGGAFFYMRGRRQWLRALALPIAFILTVPISALMTTLSGYSGAQTTAVGKIILPLLWLGWASVPLWPGFANQLWRRFRPA
ncbi:MAG: hypothetical protein GY803_18355 [Chloroflexi bacterium]|nr:hypothetical protein [Chloroflexota bacterium]